MALAVLGWGRYVRIMTKRGEILPRRELRHSQGTASSETPAPRFALQPLAAVAGTMIGETLGSNLTEKLIAGALAAAISAFLTAPGKHHRRRIMAVALLLALLHMLRRAANALATSRRHRRLPRETHAPTPANWATVGLATVVGFTLGSLATTAIDGWASGPRTQDATIPEVAGQSEPAALGILEEAQLTPVSVREPSISTPEGRAKRSSPPAGAKTRPGTTVTVFVSSGEPEAGAKITIPNVGGLSKRRARAMLQDLGLTIVNEEQSFARLAPGKATGTSPPAATRVPVWSAVTLLVSAGPLHEEVVVPSVRGQPRSLALARLRGAGLNPTIRFKPSETIAAGHALGTDPVAGAKIKGDGVTLYLSSADAPVRVEVPVLFGLSLNGARARLVERGLRITSTTESATQRPAGTVVDSNPAPGTLVAKGSVVRVIVAGSALPE